MLTFSYTGNAYEVTGQVEPLETDIVIPAAFDDGVNGVFPVTSIGWNAFANNQLTNVSIPNSITSIEGQAFSYNQLTSVTIPSSVTSIGANAFYKNQLTSVVIPNNVTSIGLGAFSNNQLTSVTIPDSVTNIEYSAFASNQLTTVVWETNQSIPSWSFTTNKITSFTITSDINVSLANTDAFDGVTTENPMTVYVQPQLIEDYKIATNWTTLYNAGKCDFVDIALASAITKLKPYLTAIKEAIQFKDGSTGNVNVQDMPQMIRDLPSSLEYLMRNSTPAGSKAILTQDGDGTLHAEIPNSVTSIGQSAFYYNQLTSVVIPDSVTNIGNYAFYNNQLTSVVWETTAQIQSNTFAGSNNKITSFTITSDVLIALTNIDAFDGVTVNQPMTVYVQPQLIEDYKVATNWSDLYNDGKCDFVDIALVPTE